MFFKGLGIRVEHTSTFNASSDYHMLTSICMVNALTVRSECTPEVRMRHNSYLFPDPFLFERVDEITDRRIQDFNAICEIIKPIVMIIPLINLYEEEVSFRAAM